MRQNLEIKARLVDRAKAREQALEVGARCQATEVQRDTFFHAREGRLKLRVIDATGGVTSAWLIAYQRGDHSEARVSSYSLVEVTDPQGLREALGRALGIRGEVRKTREILLWKNVRIHLDQVAGLGDYLEYEAVLSDAMGEDLAASRESLHVLSTAMGIDDSVRVAVAYADLLGI